MRSEGLTSLRAVTAAAALLLAVLAGSGRADSLAGLWQAEKTFVPKHHGRLLVSRDEGWRAELGGVRVNGAQDGQRVRFAFPGGERQFLGGGETLVLRLTEAGGIDTAQWIQRFSYRVGLGNSAPLTLIPTGQNHWPGNVAPMEDGFSFYLVLTERPDDALGAFLRNPDRNLGVFLNLKRAARDGHR